MTIRAALDARYSFTRQYLSTAKEAARQARRIEERYTAREPSEAVRSKHLGFATTAVFHSYAAIEAELWSVLNHGPGHHLGTNRIDHAALRILEPLAELLEWQDVLVKCKAILHVLQRRPLPNGRGATQRLILLARLRNELVHYKSRWNAQMSDAGFVRGLRAQHFSVPPFRRNAAVYFPLQVLGASCAAWSVRTSFEFLLEFYECLGVAHPLTDFRVG